MENGQAQRDAIVAPETPNDQCICYIPTYEIAVLAEVRSALLGPDLVGLSPVPARAATSQGRRLPKGSKYAVSAAKEGLHFVQRVIRDAKLRKQKAREEARAASAQHRSRGGAVLEELTLRNQLEAAQLEAQAWIRAFGTFSSSQQHSAVSAPDNEEAVRPPSRIHCRGGRTSQQNSGGIAAEDEDEFFVPPSQIYPDIMGSTSSSSASSPARRRMPEPDIEWGPPPTNAQPATLLQSLLRWRKSSFLVTLAATKRRLSAARILQRAWRTRGISVALRLNLQGGARPQRKRRVDPRTANVRTALCLNNK